MTINQNQHTNNEEYLLTLRMLAIENQSQATMFNTFLITHSIFCGCIMGYVLKNETMFLMNCNITCFIFCCLGLCLTFLWFLAYYRGSVYFNLWKQQLKTLTNNFHLFDAEESLQNGALVNNVKLYFRKFTHKKITYALIICFAIIYIAGVFCFAPWN